MIDVDAALASGLVSYKVEPDDLMSKTEEIAKKMTAHLSAEQHKTTPGSTLTLSTITGSAGSVKTGIEELFERQLAGSIIFICMDKFFRKRKN